MAGPRTAALAILAALACAGTASADPTTGLLEAYSFDELSGKLARDGSGNGHHGRLVGARRTVPGRFGGAVSFRRPGDVVSVGRRLRRSGARSSTFAAWVKPLRARRHWRAVVSAGNAKRPAHALYVRPRGAGARVGKTRAHSRRRLRGWSHLASTYDGRVLRLYVDGRRVARRAVRGGGSTGLRGPLRIGGSGRGPHWFRGWFRGVVDEVRVYARALSARELRDVMRHPIGTPGRGEPGPAPGTGPVPIYTRDNSPPTPTVDELPLVSSVSKDGVTWTFTKPARVGHFITGDPYVLGPVTVTAISPAPSPGRDGSVKNLPAVDDETGFDDRVDGNRFEPDLRASPPVALAPGDSLVSSISESAETIGTRRRWLFSSHSGSPVRSVSVLTAVAAPQPPDAFRPSYAGHGPTYLTRNLRRELLPRLARLSRTDEELVLAEYTDHFRRPWPDNLFYTFDSPAEYMPDYGREIARAVGGAGLLLSLDHPPEQKEALLVYLTQYGIDLSGLLAAGHPGWYAHGGHGSGRKFPIVFAGTLLGEPAMQSPQGDFGEDMQTIHGSGWNGASVLYAGHMGVEVAGWEGPYEHLQPRDWPADDDGTYVGESYRRCCTSSAWVPEALAATLIPGVRAGWGHPAFFDYVDRWMTDDDAGELAIVADQLGQAVADDFARQPQREAFDESITELWRAYR